MGGRARQLGLGTGSKCRSGVSLKSLNAISASNKLPVLTSHTALFVNQILAAKRADAGADTSAQEAEIDRHVYALYLPAPRFALLAWQPGGLTPAEIKIVESASAK